MPVVPMFHANAWGMPYGSAMAGADLVMPGPDLSGEALARLIETERVTVSGAVPTIWMDLLRYADEHAPDLSSLRTVVCGGSAVPLSLMRAFEDRHDVRILQAWGMTETSPLGSVALPPPHSEGEAQWRYRAHGRQARAARRGPASSAATARRCPGTATSTGELQVRGPWVARAYYEDDSSDEKFDDGWLRTGDIAVDRPARLHPHLRPRQGRHQVGRRVDLVGRARERDHGPPRREGGGGDREARRALGRASARLRRHRGGRAGSRSTSCATHLADRVAKFWLPDALAFIDEVPKTSVGKFDKKVLRARLEEGRLEQAEPAQA